jgi:hypothetical protein
MGTEKKLLPNPWIAIIISIAAFIVSSTTLYFTHFHTSESVYMLFLDHPPTFLAVETYKENEVDREAVNYNLGLVNSGNQNVIISSLMLIQSPGLPDEISIQARNPENDKPIPAILLSPHAVQQLDVRFTFEGTPFRELKSQPALLTYMPLKLRFTTIGSSGKVQNLMWTFK